MPGVEEPDLGSFQTFRYRPRMEVGDRAFDVDQVHDRDSARSASNDCLPVSAESSFLVARRALLSGPGSDPNPGFDQVTITDGVVASNVAYFPEDLDFVDAQLSYPPRCFQRRFARERENVAVLDAGISGNRLLAGPLIPQFGPAGLSRLDEDVLALSGVIDVIVLEGINDLGYPPFADADQLIHGLETATATLRAHGLRVHLGTILPASRSVLDGTLTSPGSNRERQKVNAWIRTQQLAGVIDFDAALRDPQNPAVVRADLIGPDNLHPNAAGYEAMANVVPLSMFRQRC